MASVVGKFAHNKTAYSATLNRNVPRGGNIINDGPILSFPVPHCEIESKESI